MFHFKFGISILIQLRIIVFATVAKYLLSTIIITVTSFVPIC